MSQLPRTQPESVSLTNSMIAGFTNYPGTFPSADIPKLQEMLESFDEAKRSFNAARSAFKQAGKHQKQVFEELKGTIANQIKTAQVDTAEMPTKIALIGFGTRRKKSSQNLPAQPVLMDIKAISDGVIKLSWQKNRRRSCGPVVIFNIEIRTMGNCRSAWKLAGTSFDCDKVLQNQPQGKKLEYRIIATNRSGHSCPSNTLSVIL